MKRRIVFLMLVLLIFVSNSMSPLASSSPPRNNEISKEEFLELVKKNNYYNQYKNSFLSKDEPYVLNNTYDIENNIDGWIVQYEFKYKEKGPVKDEVVVTNLSSILSFMYSFETQKVSVAIVDYSKLLSEEVIIVEDLDNKKSNKIPVEESGNEALVEFIEDMKQKEAKKEEEILQMQIDGSTELATSSYLCWQCQSYATGGGYTDKNCVGLIGATCRLSSWHWATKLACQGGKYIACYVPSWQHCASGQWKTTCPVQA